MKLAISYLIFFKYAHLHKICINVLRAKKKLSILYLNPASEGGCGDLFSQGFTSFVFCFFIKAVDTDNTGGLNYLMSKA